MSTRKILKDRRKGLIWLWKKEPDNTSIPKALAELDYIFEKLKEYDGNVQAGG